MMKKNNGNSGLYGRVTKKQMGGAAKPIGMIGRRIVAGRPPPDGGGMRTMDFRDQNRNRIGPPLPGGRMPMPGRSMPVPPGPGVGERRSEYGSGAPKLPGGGRLTPPEMGPNPDAERMRPRRFGGMGASIIEALGIKSGKMGDRSRNAPPRPANTGLDFKEAAVRKMSRNAPPRPANTGGRRGRGRRR